MKWIDRRSNAAARRGVAMSKRRRLVELLIAAGAVGAMAGLHVAFSSDAVAESDGTVVDPGGTVDDSISPSEREPRDFFAPYPAGEGRVPYEELEEEEQKAIDAAALWAETGNGHQVHAEYSRLARVRGKEARETRAAQLAGTQGFEELGVE